MDNQRPGRIAVASFAEGCGPARGTRTAPRSRRSARDWRDDAACRDVDPELFFPDGTAGPARLQAEQARRVCQSCPVQQPCLCFALRHSLGFGIWGGTTGESRRFIARGEPEPPDR
jgi:WhiB family redox-sensing transcriptional regulator